GRSDLRLPPIQRQNQSTSQRQHHEDGCDPPQAVIQPPTQRTNSSPMASLIERIDSHERHAAKDVNGLARRTSRNEKRPEENHSTNGFDREERSKHPEER